MRSITVETIVNNRLEEVWKDWNEPEAIMQWAFASDDWEAPHAENDLHEGGAFLTTMRAKDRSTSFDFTGIYTEVIPLKRIAYRITGGREVEVDFEAVGDDQTRVCETFEMENENSEEMQRAGWQAILENFKKYSESNRKAA